MFHKADLLSNSNNTKYDDLFTQLYVCASVVMLSLLLNLIPFPFPQDQIKLI